MSCALEAFVLSESHVNYLIRKDIDQNGSFHPSIFNFSLGHFLTLLYLCLTVVVLHRDTICPLSDLCISNLNIAYTLI